MVAVTVRLARGLPDTGALRQPPEGLGTRAGRRSRPVAPPDVSGPAGHLVGVPHAVDVERLLHAVDLRSAGAADRPHQVALHRTAGRDVAPRVRRLRARRSRAPASPPARPAARTALAPSVAAPELRGRLHSHAAAGARRDSRSGARPRRVVGSARGLARASA